MWSIVTNDLRNHHEPRLTCAPLAQVQPDFFARNRDVLMPLWGHLLILGSKHLESCNLLESILQYLQSILSCFLSHLFPFELLNLPVYCWAKVPRLVCWFQASDSDSCLLPTVHIGHLCIARLEWKLVKHIGKNEKTIQTNLKTIRNTMSWCLLLFAMQLCRHEPNSRTTLSSEPLSSYKTSLSDLQCRMTLMT